MKMSNFRLPPLNGIRAFEAVARTGSVRDAADILAVHSTAVSRQIKNLETWLDTTLFDRGPNGIQLTLEGQNYFERISAALSDISEATRQIRPTEKTREFRIWCGAALAFNWLIPRLPSLQAVLPRFNILVRPTDEFANLSKEEAHVEIRYGTRFGDGIKTCLLSRPRVFPVASESYFAGRPILQSLEQIVDHVLIHERDSSIWHMWLRKAGCETNLHDLKGPCVWDCNFALAAAGAGVGVALCTHLTAGKLIHDRVVTELSSPPVVLEPFMLHASTHLWNSLAVSKVRQWFLDNMSVRSQ